MKEEHREKIRRQWLALLPLMVSTDSYVGFEAYYEDVTGANVDNRPTEAILADVEQAEKELENGT